MAIGTAAAIGLGITAVTTGASFAQSAAQKKEQKKAEAEAQKYLAEARKKLDVNFYEQLGIQKEPYELEREAMLIQGAQSIEAGRESERGAAALAGRVQLAQQQGQRQIAAAMGQEMLGLEKLTAQEESRLRDSQANLDIRESMGAQQAAAVAEGRSAQALSEGMKGVASLGGQVAAAIPDYKKSASVKQFGKLSSAAEKAGLNTQQFQQQLSAFGASSPTFANLAGVGAMDPTKFMAFMGGLSPEYLKQLQGAFSPTALNTQPVQGQGMIGPQ